MSPLLAERLELAYGPAAALDTLAGELDDSVGALLANADSALGALAEHDDWTEADNYSPPTTLEEAVALVGALSQRLDDALATLGAISRALDVNDAGERTLVEYRMGELHALVADLLPTA